jgi:hypothetical protein
MPSKSIYRQKSLKEMKEDLIAVLHGKQAILRRQFVIDIDGDRIKVNAKQVTQEEYETMKTTIHPDDTVIFIINQTGNDPIVEITGDVKIPSWVDPIEYARSRAVKGSDCPGWFSI